VEITAAKDEKFEKEPPIVRRKEEKISPSSQSWQTSSPREKEKRQEKRIFSADDMTKRGRSNLLVSEEEIRKVVKMPPFRVTPPRNISSIDLNASLLNDPRQDFKRRLKRFASSQKLSNSPSSSSSPHKSNLHANLQEFSIESKKSILRGILGHSERKQSSQSQAQSPSQQSASLHKAVSFALDPASLMPDGDMALPDSFSPNFKRESPKTFPARQRRVLVDVALPRRFSKLELTSDLTTLP